jgi:glutamine synthetase
VQVLTEYVHRGALNTTQAIKVVEDVFFNTSNKLYKLGLSLPPHPQIVRQPSHPGTSAGIRDAVDPTLLTRFLSENSSTKYVRLQWLDYTSTNRVRVLPIKHALSLFQEGKSIGITKAVLGLLQNDTISPGFAATGEYTLTPCFESLRRGERSSYATVQCEFRQKCGNQVANCPRTVLRRIVENAAANGIEFLVGFEIEVVFTTVSTKDGEFHYGEIPVSEGHAWSSSRSLQNGDTMSIVEAIADALENSGIQLQQFHPESSPGQYEFITGPLPPLQAVDTLLAAREIISAIAATHFPHKAFRATFIPRPFPNAAGTGAHAHISMTPDANYEMFYAGVLKHLRAITAFTYSHDLSYERVKDGIWAGGRWIAWGTQNRETPLRKIEDSHWEIKCIDGLANTYLALGAILGAGLQGILDRTELMMEDCLADPSTLTARERVRLGIRDNIPASLAEALECLWGDGELREILGQEAVRTYVAVKGAGVGLLEEMEPEARRRWLIERY